MSNFRIEYVPATVGHLKALTARQQSIVLDGVARYLSSDPMVETRNRKPMRPNPLAPWELRLGSLRVYFNVVIEPEPVVETIRDGVGARWMAFARSRCWPLPATATLMMSAVAPSPRR